MKPVEKKLVQGMDLKLKKLQETDSRGEVKKIVRMLSVTANTLLAEVEGLRRRQPANSKDIE